MIRRWLILGALACTLLACWWVEQAEPQSGIEVTANAPVPRRVPLAKVMPVPVIESQPMAAPVGIVADAKTEAGVNLFSAMEMPAAETAAAAISEPVSPYTYAGRLQEEGRWTVFLTDGQQQYVLHEGDHFAQGWKVAVLDQQKVILQHAAERFEIRLDNGVVF